jgi:hypothetical protein
VAIIVSKLCRFTQNKHWIVPEAKTVAKARKFLFQGLMKHITITPRDHDSAKSISSFPQHHHQTCIGRFSLLGSIQNIERI